MQDIRKQPLGMYKTNCYVLRKNGTSIIIDPGLYPEKVMAMIGDTMPLAILVTHCHCDHVCAIDPLCKAYQIPVYMHEADGPLLLAKRRTPSAYRGFFKTPFKALPKGFFSIGPFAFQIWETPGHTLGSVTIQWENHLFTGDTLFTNTIGDIDDIDKPMMKASLETFLQLDPHCIVHPGHKDDGVLGDIIAHNKRFRELVFPDSI